MSMKGFHPVGTLSGSPWQGAVRTYNHGAAESDIFVGDLVTQLANGNINAAAAGDTNILGACVGVFPVTKPLPSGTLAMAGTTLKLEQKHTNNGEVSTVAVCTAPDAIYKARTSGAALALADVGLNADHIAGTGSYVSGLSGHEINTIGKTTVAAGLRIIGISETPDNTPSTSNAEWLVVLNESHFRTGKAGI